MARNCSMVPMEPQWRTNSSFSPPSPPRRSDCRFQPDGLHHGFQGASLCGSSLSSNSKGHRRRVNRDYFPNHHHSMSDGVVSYFGSPSDNFQPPRWTPPVQKLNSDDFSTPSMGGSRSEISLFPHSTERQFNSRASAASNSLASPSSLSESSQWESISKRPISFPLRNFSSRRSFMSKPVYPLVFRNPISDSEAFGLPISDSEAFGSAGTSSVSRLTPSENRILPYHWPDNRSIVELKFHKTLSDLQKIEASPHPSMSSRREGFRWSNASSYDLGFDGESFDVAEHEDLESLRSPNYLSEDQKCGLCGRLLWQKSPWSSYRIVRGVDMPIAGVLSCSHVFHADCLEQTTPKTRIHDPPCPLCLKTIGVAEESPSVSEPLQVALRSVRMNRGVVISDAPGISGSDKSSELIESTIRRNLLSQPVPETSGSSTLIKKHFKKHFTFKGKMSKDFFRTKMFRRSGASSSSLDQVGPSRSSRK